MANIENIRVITSTYKTLTSNYAMIEFTIEGKKFFGTVDKNLFKNGKATRNITLLELAEGKTVQDAINHRSYLEETQAIMAYYCNKNGVEEVEDLPREAFIEYVSSIKEARENLKYEGYVC